MNLSSRFCCQWIKKARDHHLQSFPVSPAEEFQSQNVATSSLKDSEWIFYRTEGPKVTQSPSEEDGHQVFSAVKAALLAVSKLIPRVELQQAILRLSNSTK